MRFAILAAVSIAFAAPAAALTVVEQPQGGFNTANLPQRSIGGGEFANLPAWVDGTARDDAPNAVPGGDAGVVPEPATWAMLIAGFALVGAAARRRAAPGIRGHHLERTRAARQ